MTRNVSDKEPTLDISYLGPDEFPDRVAKQIAAENQEIHERVNNGQPTGNYETVSNGDGTSTVVFVPYDS